MGVGGTRQCFPDKREEDEETTCQVGDSKKLDCNTCICAGYEDKTFWMCTMMFCGEKREVKVNKVHIDKFPLCLQCLH